MGMGKTNRSGSQCQYIFGGAVSTPFEGNGGRMGSEIVPQVSGPAILFVSSGSIGYLFG